MRSNSGTTQVIHQTVIVLAVALFASTRSVTSTFLSPSEPVYRDLSSKAGIDMVIRSGIPEKPFLVEGITGGVCLFDYNNDGRLDIYFVNGSNSGAYLANTTAYSSRLYRNNEGGTFSDVTKQAGVGGAGGWGMGCSSADFNNDGFEDLYVTNLGRNVLYRNNGNGTFSDVSRSSGTDYLGWSTGSAWGDFDKDGLLDLYVANYVDFDFKNLPLPGSGEFCRYLGLPVMCGPRGLTGAADVFFRNNGNETFSDETEKRGLNAPSYFGLGVSAGDYDNDGDLDIFVANDSTPNFLFQNQGKGTFKEVGLLAGVAFNEDGNAQACMGVDLADYDNDGFLDVIVTNFARDTNTLYHNEGKGLFRDLSTHAGMRDSYPYMGWGVNFIDYDNDGFRDIYVVNGHLYPQVDSTKAEMGYLQADLLYRNVGSGRFLNVSSLLVHGKHVGRGAGFGDLNNDGRVDVVISNLDDQPSVLLNRHESNNHWIVVRCIGTESNRNALGSRVTIVTELGNQTGEVHSGGSYLSSGDQRLHFGLGQVKEIKELRINWPSGRSTLLRGIAVDQVLTIKEPQNS
jgi:hypothetical protein